MSNFKIFSTGIVAIALSLATGCTPTTPHDQTTSEAPLAQSVQTTESPSPTASPTASPTTPGQNTLSSSDIQFITEAAQGGLAEVQLAQLALKRGTSNAVKRFAQRMIKDHNPVNTQLEKLAKKKGVTPPTSLDSTNQQVKKRLSKLTGATFDRKYMNQMLEDHQNDVSAFETEAKQGQDPDVKAFAAQKLPTLRAHLQQAGSIVNPGSSTSTPTPTSTPTSTSTP
ncbi:DUF4142 domain-containing protein [Nostoc sp.]|uniref:DUF4142 domain-containing protein n=1 Tax=Nostoc sp. TaxID=1180 RepID=UPI002FFC8B77